MTTASKALSRTLTPLSLAEVKTPSWLTPAWTQEQRLEHIEAMGQRIISYISFICHVGALEGTSAEAKERAVNAFYERMLVVEKQLGRIQEELRLA